MSVSYVIGIDVTSLRKRWWNGHDQQDLRRGLPSRESVREIHSHGQTSTQFSIGWHLSIIGTLVFSFFRYRLYPFLFIGALWLSPDLRQLTRFFPSLSVFPTPPKICTIQIKRRRLRSAYQCCFYRIGARQTSARFTLLPPLFSELLCFIRRTGTARILLGT